MHAYPGTHQPHGDPPHPAGADQGIWPQLPQDPYAVGQQAQDFWHQPLGTAPHQQPQYAHAHPNAHLHAYAHAHPQPHPGGPLQQAAHLPQSWSHESQHASVQHQLPPTVPLEPPPLREPAPAASVHRLRIAGAVVGALLLAFALYNLASHGLGSDKDDARDGKITQLGKAPEIEPAQSSGADAGAKAAAPAGDPDSLAPGATSRAAAAPRTPKKPAKPRAKRSGPAAATAGTTRLAAADARAAAGPPTAVAGSGSNALPYTGASHWIAGILGFLLVGAGCYMQLNAARIGDSAALYQRGPLLRPLDTLRAAAMDASTSSRLGDVATRIARTLTAPGRESDFVRSGDLRY